MTGVNGFSALTIDDVEHRHLAFYLGAVTRRARRDVRAIALGRGLHLGDDGKTLGQLRPSHFRILSLIPDAGVRATDLSHVADMTKQALGQFVAHLETHGYISVEPDPSDRRARIIRRTTAGNEAVALADDLYAELLTEWRVIVGKERWAAFEDVLHALALGWDTPSGT